MIVPLGSLAANNAATGGCDIYLELLEEASQPESTNVVFGAMFLQQYIAWWSYDYSVTPAIETLRMQLSSTNTLNYAYIGNGIYQNGVEPFVYPTDTLTVNIDVDPTWKTTTVKGMLGYQGYADFGVSLLGNYVQAFSTDCYQKFAGTLFKPCSNGPSFAELYFNGTDYSDTYALSGDYGGYETSGFVYNSSVCLKAENTELFCSVINEEFAVADSIYRNLWNYGSNAGAGIYGMGTYSPVWYMLDNPASKKYDVYASNFSDYASWYNPSYFNFTGSSVLNINGWDTFYDSETTFTQIKPSITLGHLFTLEEFSFGQTYANNTKSYHTVLNSESSLGSNANQSSLALNFRGLGLPTKQFRQFQNLLGVATKGAASCVDAVGGYCILPKGCANYADLWKYDFRVKFESANDDNYLRIPLATYAIDDTQENTCSIMVEYLNANFQNSQQIIFGGMTFQQIYTRYELSGTSSADIYIYKNRNALQATYIGNAVVPDGPNTFVVQPVAVPTSEETDGNGIPTLNADIAGIAATTPYYLLDFTQDNTLVWAVNCTQSVPGFTPGPCDSEPTNAVLSFDPSDNSTGLIHRRGTFTNANFGGFVVSGTKYTTEFCLPGGGCKLIEVYSGEQIAEDNWRLGQDAAFGILGFGPNAGVWSGYTDVDSEVATYSIELARLTPLTHQFHALSQTQQEASNITFGGENSAPYIGMPSVNMTSLSNYSYELENFAFGLIYYDSNGVAVSQSFDQLASHFPVEFTTNFQGFGLPGALYTEVVNHLRIISSDTVVCSTERDGSCVMPNACSSYTNFEDYNFLFNFTGAVDGYFLRVPLATFAYNVKGSGGAAQCNIMVSYLNPADAQSDNMILGGMFFQEFFGVFNNDYSTDPTTQTAALFVGQNAQWNGTVTNVNLPIGADPFLLPSNVSAQINNMMVTVAATVQTQGPNWVNIENLGDYNYIWGTSCVQSLGSINDAACTASPTFVREDVNEKLL